jgi:methylated-DNA-[protein]-cysteine S-methyltransferase
VPLDLLGTPFQRSVWEALLAIPYGETHTYGGLAAYLEGRARPALWGALWARTVSTFWCPVIG